MEGPVGPQGPAGPYPTTLPAGQTLVGTFAIEFTANGAGGRGTSAIAFPIPLNAGTASYIGTWAVTQQ